MENHTFSDPIPFPEGSIQPCWKVHVHRRGVDEAVATLEVHPRNLPPRKANKKNKVLWKLPDTLEGVPRFGGLEKERLWDLFKAEKKNRRKSKKKGDDDLGGGGGVETTATNSTDQLDSVMPDGVTKERFDDGDPEPPVAVEDTSSSNGSADPPTPFHPDPPTPPPPPGFAMSKVSLNQQEEEGEHKVEQLSSSVVSANSNSCNSPKPPPPPGLGPVSVDPPIAEQQPQQQQQQSPPQPPRPAPPPGLQVDDTLTRSPPQPPTQSTTIQQQQPPQPPAPPPVVSFSFGSLRAADIHSLPAASLSSVIGGHVAQILIHALTTPGQLPVWLAHYHANAQKLLLFGTAQAVAQTAADRQQQWESLIVPPPPATNEGAAAGAAAAAAAWDVQGWAVQTIPSLPHLGNGSGVGTLSTLLVVLTGRTLQRQELLTYHLTLTLRSIHPAEQQAPPQQQQPHGNAHMAAAAMGPTQYQIYNEILSLSRGG